MRTNVARIWIILGLLAASGGSFAFAQQHDHSQHGSSQASASGQGKSSAADKDEEAIFCPTMKTGQLCSHGTSAIFGFTGKKQDEWEALTHRYNKAVDAATIQLFKDAESVLTPEQLALLKAWFAVGLNPEINQLLASKGLGPKKP